MARISVIVPCYNSSAFVAETIESILRQDMTEWELILVDDGSTDFTPEFLREYSAKDVRIRSIRKYNGGRANACNLGILQSSPEAQYLFFLDSDDLLIPQALRVMSSYLDQHPDVGLLGSQFQEIDENGHAFGTSKRSRWVPGLLFPRQLSDDEPETPFVTFFCATGQGPFAMYRKSVFQRTKGWEPALSCFSAHEDTDIFCQMALLAPVHYIPDRLYLKRVHSGAITQQIGRIQNAYGVFRQKWDHYQTDDPKQQEILRRAKKHYYTRHRPLRDLKVAAQTLNEFVRHPSKAGMSWFFCLCKSGLNGFLFGGSTEEKHSLHL